ncbi:hypothetical protein [Nostoc sp.]|uniref:hypothetical protein n=1 Tax=Nostoc sp. TaxID=1180 RepID=UPI002FFCD2EA
MRLVVADLNPVTNPVTNDDSDASGEGKAQRSLRCNIGFGSNALMFPPIADGESVKVYIKSTNSNYDSPTN